jgi:hypothetical protein
MNNSSFSNGSFDEALEKIHYFLREEKANPASCDFGFNIFEITGIDVDEVRICRVFGELLTINGSHGQNRRYLDLFFDIVLKTNRPEGRVRLYMEKLVENSRRIDIVIEDVTRVIPIEVKIYAEEQKNQCVDYAKYRKGSPVYYLTIDGHRPSDYSAHGLAEEDVKVISWNESILEWLNACIEATDDKNGFVSTSLRQFISAVKKFSLVDAIRNQRERLIENRLESIDEILREHKWRHPQTHDTGINYEVGKSGFQFFRVQSEGGGIVAGTIAGAKKQDGNWVFGSEPEVKEIRKENGANAWWIRKEIVVPYNKLHLLFDEDRFRDYIERIVELYKEWDNE